MIEFNCPHCGKALKASDAKAGLQPNCPGCGRVVLIPNASEGDSYRAAREVELVQDPDRAESQQERLSRKREMRPFPPGEVISEAARIFANRMGLLIGALLVVSVLPAIPFGLAFGLLVLASMFLEANNLVGAYVSGSLLVGLTVLTIVLSFYLQTGYSILCLKVAREQPARLSDLFSGARFLVRMIVSSILFYLMVGFGFLACFIPGLLLAAIFSPFGYALINEDRPNIQCLKRAKELTDGNWGSMLIVIIVSFVCHYAGSIPCYIGLIFAVPYISVLNALAYDRMTHQTPLHEINKPDQ